MDSPVTRLRRDARGLIFGDLMNLVGLPLLLLPSVFMDESRPVAVALLTLIVGWFWLRNSGSVRLTEETIAYGTLLRRRTLQRSDVVLARTGRTYGARGVELLGIELVLHDGSIEHLTGSVNQGIPRHNAWIDAVNEWVPPLTTRVRAEVFLLPTHAVIATSDLTTNGDWLRSDRIEAHHDFDAESIGESIEACLTRSQIGVGFQPPRATDDQDPVATQRLLQVAACDSWNDLIATSEHIVVLQVADQHEVIHHTSTTRSPDPFTEILPRIVVPVGDTVALTSAVLAPSKID